MLSSLGGMFQHFWSLPISMSLTQPNHRTNNQVSSSLTPHTHTHTHTHTEHMYAALHTHTDTQTTHVYHTSHIHKHNTHITLHTHTDTHTRTVPPWGQGPWYPSPFPRQGLVPGRYPTTAPGPLLPGPADWSWLLLCRVLLDHVSWNRPPLISHLPVLLPLYHLLGLK